MPDRGYTSDSELTAKSNSVLSESSHQKSSITVNTNNSATTTPYISPSGDNWIIVNKESDVLSLTAPSTPTTNSLVYPCRLLSHSSFALVKCWDSLAFIVRNVAHITPYNFESCVKCIRTFVEASLNGGKSGSRHGRRKNLKKDSRKSPTEQSSESEDEDLLQRYEFIAIQLLDLMHTLHTRTAQIFIWWAEEGGALPQHSALWAHGWCPLLQGIARLANDKRRQVSFPYYYILSRSVINLVILL